MARLGYFRLTPAIPLSATVAVKVGRLNVLQEETTDSVGAAAFTCGLFSWFRVVSHQCLSPTEFPIRVH